MSEQVSITVQEPEKSPEEIAEGLAKAAENAPTTTEEAAALIAKEKEEGTKDTSDQPSKVEGLPEKFKSVDDLAKAYAELEAKLGRQGKKPEGGDEKKPEGEPEAKDEDKATVEKVDIVALTDEFNEKGELSDESYTKLESLGFTREFVDAYAAGQVALAEAATARITEAAGGKENMEQMFAWAGASLTANEIETFNKSFEGSDVNSAVIAMEQLKTKYQEANGIDPKLVTGNTSNGNVDTYQSWAQVTKDMDSKDYQIDPAFRAKVQAKLGRSRL